MNAAPDLARKQAHCSCWRPTPCDPEAEGAFRSWGRRLLRLNGVNKDEEFDPTTCVGSFAGTGTWKVVGGTGPFEDAKGRGTFSFEGGFQAVPGPSGDCLDDGATGGIALEFTGTVALAGEGEPHAALRSPAGLPGLQEGGGALSMGGGLGAIGSVRPALSLPGAPAHG